MKKLYTLLTAIALSALPQKALAVVVINNATLPPAVSTGPTAAELIANTVSTLLFVAGALSVVALVAGGIMYITSGGNEQRITTAKNTILYAIVGIIVALSAFAIASFVNVSITA